MTRTILDGMKARSRCGILFSVGSEQEMSLRFRLIGLVAIILVVSLAFGSAIACFNASRSVRTEMRSAQVVGRQTIENAIDGLQNSPDPARDLENLVGSFKGNRHLRVALSGDAASIALPAIDTAPLGGAPAWFVGLIGVAPATDRVPVTLAGRVYGTVTIETDPRNEILEVWNEFSDSLIMLALFSGSTILLIHLFIGRALRPLNDLAAALEQVGHGAYGTRIAEHVAPELSPLRDSFNRMAARLAEMDMDRRRLTDQLLTLQEQERGDLARDLHDEVSPFLFAINVDVANISRLLEEGRSAGVPDHLQSIVDAVGHLQRQVRSMLGRLQPTGLAEFGLTAAIGAMVEFWRRRHPGIDYRLSIRPECDGLGEPADTTIYRVVQECLSNALRHGKPAAVTISIERVGDGANGPEVTVVVADDGQGMSEPAALGFGLRGMRERVRAIGGRLTVSGRLGGGFEVVAALPCPPRREAMSAAFEAATP
jgi:two-component system, NarL family, sensor histidine kinase UhpB